MGNCLKASLLLAWFSLQALAVIIEHHPVLEGSNTTLECSGKVNGTSTTVYWQVVGRNISKYDAAYCNVSIWTCHSHNDSKYTVKVISSRDKFSSQLTINSVDFNDKDNVIICSVLGSNSKGQSWNLSEILAMPSSPKCHAKTTDYREVNITCHTPRVYPELRCEVTVAGEDVPMDTRKMLESSHVYYSATCFHMVEELPPGVHSFKVKMFPGFKVVGNANSTVVVNTNKVNISSEPYIKLTIPRQNPCTPPDVVMCGVFWFPAAPNVTLYLENTPMTAVGHMNTSVSVDNIIYRKFVWIYHVLESTLADSRNVKCVAVYREGNSTTSKEFVENQILNEYFAPPIFKYENGQEIKANNLEVDYKENIMLACEAKEMNQHYSSTTITCQALSAQRILNFSRSSAVINVSLKESIEWYCSCIVEHKNRCYTPVTNLTLYTANRYPTFYRNENTNKQTIFIIFIACICIVVIILVVAFCVYNRKRLGLKRRRDVHRGNRSRSKYSFDQRNCSQKCQKLLCKRKHSDLNHRTGVCQYVAHRRVSGAGDDRSEFSVRSAEGKRGVHVNTTYASVNNADVKGNIRVNTVDVECNVHVDTTDDQRGVANRTDTKRGVLNRTDDQRGVLNRTDDQRGVLNRTDATRGVHLNTADFSHNANLNTTNVIHGNLKTINVTQDHTLKTADTHPHSNLNTQLTTAVNDKPPLLNSSPICEIVENIFSTDTTRKRRLAISRQSEESNHPTAGVIDDCSSAPPPPIPPRRKMVKPLNKSTSANTLATNRDEYPQLEKISRIKACLVKSQTQDPCFSSHTPELPVLGHVREQSLSNKYTTQREVHNANECMAVGPHFNIKSECDNAELPEIPPRRPIRS